MIETLISILAPTFLVSLFMIIFKLEAWGHKAWPSFRHDPLWPKRIIDYKKVSKEKLGRIGILYFVAMYSGIACLVLLMLELLLHLKTILS